jgi:hypothetical protein
MDGHLRRIEREAGLPGLADALARLAPSDLQSLLLHVFRAQAGRRDPATVLRHYQRDPSVKAGAPVHEARAYAAAEGFEPVALAPVAPLGLNAVLGGIDQNNVGSTIRMTEVLADPTASLALEAAVRRRAGEDVVRLCAVCRVLRLQPVPDVPGFTQHFALFALVTAGRARASHGFEAGALAEHVAVHRRLLAAHGVQDCEVRLTDAPAPVLAAVPGAIEDPDRTRARGYYTSALLDITADAAGEAVSLADGGCVDWTQRLLSDRRERLVTSGLGLGLLAARF